MPFLFFTTDNGQLEFHSSDLEHIEEHKNYDIFTEDSSEIIVERQHKKHFLYVSYCNIDGGQFTESLIKRPVASNLSSIEIRRGMYIGVFYRLKHHTAGIRTLILKVMDVNEECISVHVALHKFTNQIIPWQFKKFVTHGSHQLSSNYPLPYNISGKMCYENMLFVPRNQKSVSVTSDNKQIISTNISHKTSFFAQTCYRKTTTDFSEFRAHVTPLSIITKDDFLSNVLLNLKRIPKEYHNNLVTMHTKQGNDYIAIEDDTGLYGVSFAPCTKELALHRLNRESVVQHTHSIRKIDLVTWNRNRPQKKTCSL